MSKEEYANEIKKLAYHYNQGKKDERKRILKLIDEKIKKIDLLPNLYEDTAYEYGMRVLEQLKEQLRK